MNTAELINLSLEQCVDALGDPTPVVFERMYERFPALDHFRSDDTSWEHYMMQEIMANIFQYVEDPGTALLTIRDMTAHHRLIGLPLDVFKGMYSTLFEVLSPSFAGENKEIMRLAWLGMIDDIHRCVDQQALIV